MTLQEACRILGISLGTEKKEINSAYEILMKVGIVCDGEKTHDGKRRAAKEKKNTVWDAPSTYCKGEISVEDR